MHVLLPVWHVLLPIRLWGKSTIALIPATHYKDGKVSKGYTFQVQKGICRVRERYVKGKFDEPVFA